VIVDDDAYIRTFKKDAERRW